jgi:hypothetical protein
MSPADTTTVFGVGRPQVSMWVARYSAPPASIVPMRPEARRRLEVAVEVVERQDLHEGLNKAETAEQYGEQQVKCGAARTTCRRRR